MPVNNNVNGNNTTLMPPRPTPPPRNSVMFAQPPKFPVPMPKSPAPQPQSQQLPVVPPKANAKYRYSVMMPSTAVPLPMPGDAGLRRTTLTDQGGYGQGPSLYGNTAGNPGLAPSPPKSPKPRGSMMFNPNMVPGLAPQQPEVQNNHTAINSNATAANNSAPQSTPTFVMPRPVSISNAPQINGEGPPSPRQSPNASVIVTPMQNRPTSMSVVVRATFPNIERNSSTYDGIVLMFSLFRIQSPRGRRTCLKKGC
jgi:hypothetical protein